MDRNYFNLRVIDIIDLELPLNIPFFVIEMLCLENDQS